VDLVKKPVRTCINCRGKFHQNNLLRLQCINKQLDVYKGFGRSFYLCDDCVNQDINRLCKSIYRQCKNKADYEKQLKEIIEEWMTK
jgi:predicted RNA-binding protein YlxR (DUF448 family)